MKPLSPLSPEPDVPRAPRPKNFGLWILGIVVGSLVIAVVALIVTVVPGYGHARAAARGRACLANVKSISLAMTMYAAANDDTLPPASDWMDTTMPFAHNRRAYRCPGAPGPRRSVRGYAMNKALSSKELASIKDLAGTPVVFDSTATGPNAAGGLDLLPDPARHPKGNSVGYLDGHAEQVRAGKGP
jgi:prepilin-type processing-associated H-X9-DG protein